MVHQGYFVIQCTNQSFVRCLSTAYSAGHVSTRLAYINTYGSLRNNFNCFAQFYSDFWCAIVPLEIIINIQILRDKWLLSFSRNVDCFLIHQLLPGITQLTPESGNFLLLIRSVVSKITYKGYRLIPENISAVLLMWCIQFRDFLHTHVRQDLYDLRNIGARQV